MANEITGEIKPLTGPFGPLKWCLIFYLIFEILYMGVNGFTYWYIHTNGADPFESDAVALMPFFLTTSVAGLGYMLFFVLCVIFTCVWTFRAAKNLHLAKSKEMFMRPGWAVGWYFVPFANLYKPFQGMDEIWRGSRKSAGLSAVKLPTGIKVWWILWIATNIVSNISMRLSMTENDLNAYKYSLAIDALVAPFSFLCAFLLLRATGEITEYQKHISRGSVEQVFG